MLCPYTLRKGHANNLKGNIFMNIWEMKTWKKYYSNKMNRTGLRIKFDQAVDDEVRTSCKEFCAWLRSKYCFPIRIPIYVKSSRQIKALDGEKVSATFFLPDNKNDEPYIRISVGEYSDRCVISGRDNALASILRSIVHELTHYYQWINDIKLTEIGYERQAIRYADIVIDEYAQTREHP